MKLELPSILGMHFRQATGDCQSAVVVEDFWTIYRAEKDELRAAGLSVRKDDDQWELRYDPHWDRTGSAADLLVQLERAYMPKIEEARQAREAAEAEATAAHDRAVAEYEKWLDDNADTIEATVDRANRLLKEYGQGVKDKAKIAHWESGVPGKVMLRQLTDLCDAAERHIAKRARDVEIKPGVDWDDNTVTKAVEILTDADQDHAQDRNGLGWSAGHSSAGHWCYGALQDARYRDRALMLARQLVGHYVDQLAPHLPEVAQGRAA